MQQNITSLTFDWNPPYNVLYHIALFLLLLAFAVVLTRDRTTYKDTLNYNIELVVLSANNTQTYYPIYKGIATTFTLANLSPSHNYILRISATYGNASIIYYPLVYGNSLQSMNSICAYSFLTNYWTDYTGFTHYTSEGMTTIAMVLSQELNYLYFLSTNLEVGDFVELAIRDATSGELLNYFSSTLSYPLLLVDSIKLTSDGTVHFVGASYDNLNASWCHVLYTQVTCNIFSLYVDNHFELLVF